MHYPFPLVDVARQASVEMMKHPALADVKANLNLNNPELQVKIDRQLAASLDGADDQTDRQMRLLAWYFEKYRVLPEDKVIRYESIVSSQGRALDRITTRATSLDEPLESRNSADVYGRSTLDSLAERLLKSDASFWDFYTKHSVEELVHR